MRLHILLHGWLSHGQFRNHMQPWVDLAAGAGDVCWFPRSQSWAQSWNAKQAQGLGQWLASKRFPPCELVLIGHSDGATWVHGAAHAIAKTIPAERNPIVGIVHYAGLWHVGTEPFSKAIPSVFVVGERDCIAGIWHSPWRDTHRAAEAYGREVLIGAGGHRWDHRNNSEIAARLGLWREPKGSTLGAT